MPTVGRRMKVTALVLVLALIGAAALSLAIAGSTRAQEEVPCVYAPKESQPEQALEMNSVGFKGLVKTITADTELWACKFDREGIVVRRDVETFVEIIEAETKDGVILQDVQVATTTCDLALEPATPPMACSNEDIPVPTVSDPPIDDCVRYVELFDPIELNTVALDAFVKTIKVSKLILDCDAEQERELVDLYLFTERVERRIDKGTRPTFETISTSFEGVACVKDLLQGRIDRCFRFRPAAG